MLLMLFWILFLYEQLRVILQIDLLSMTKSDGILFYVLPVR